MLIELVLGILAAVLIIFISSKWNPRKQLKLWSNSLIIVALVYIGFACFKGNWGALPQELAGVLGYGALAILGYRYSPLFLVAGWVLHVCWDLLLHAPPSDIAPQWYPGVCLGFDLAVAAYLVYLIWQRNDELQIKGASSN